MDKFIIILQFLGAVAQVVFLFLKNKFEKEADLKAKKEELHKDAVEAIKERNTSKLITVIDKLRNN